MSAKFPEPEFPRAFVVDRLGKNPITESLDASGAECQALAARLGIVSLNSLSAVVTLERSLSGLIRVEGRFAADIVQICVVTLAPFPSHLEDSFTVEFGTQSVEFGDEINFDIDYDPPEPIENGVIDIGELVTQYLALALDPHPRSPGASLEAVWSNSDAAERSPFAILKNLKPPN